MTKELAALLRKKSWTGDEIGKAIIYSLVDAHRQALGGVVSPAPAFPPDQLQRMIGSLSDPAQLRRYNSYVGMQNWLIQYQAVSTAYYKQVVGELEVMSGIVNAALAVEKDLRTLDSMPQILTRKEYEELVTRRVREQLVDGDGKEKTYSVWNLLVLATAYWVVALQLHPEKENPLREIRDAYQAQPVSSQRVLSAYSGDGPPDKWEIFKRGMLRTYYPAIIGKDDGDFQAQARDFQGEFPELCAAMLRDMDKTLLAGTPSFELLPPEKWNGSACSIRTLYSGNLYDMKKLVEGDDQVFLFDRKARRNGYAILVEDFGEEPRKAGTTTLQISVKCGLEQYTPGNPDREQALSRLAESRKTVEDGYYYVKGYDKAIALMADFLNMPEFLIFALGAEGLGERMRELEKSVENLREWVRDGEYGPAETRHAKMDVLAGSFASFDWAGLAVPPAAEEAAKGLLTDNLRAFERQDSAFISLLATREGRA